MGTVSEKTMVRNNCFVARRSWGRERKFSLETPEFIKQQTVGIARVLLRQQKKKKKKKRLLLHISPRRLHELSIQLSILVIKLLILLSGQPILCANRTVLIADYC